MAESVNVSGGARALAVVQQARVRYSGMEPGQRRWMLIGAATVMAIAFATLWFTGRPDWRVLFSGLEGRDVAQVSQELAAAGIPFQATSDGTGVEVPAESLDKARMEVAAKGMPQTGRLGFELFDKPNWVGSEFDEKVNYQRALEGELEHTIGTLGAVRSARVHLVLPQETLFSGEAKAAKASVVLKLKRATLGIAEADGIRNLVAGAVDSLTPDQVTLVDADGRANLQRPGAAGEGDAEQAMEGKLVAMLEPLAGPGNVRATVHVSYDEAAEDRTDEVYDPAGAVPLSVQKSEQTSGGGAARAGGVPGTASNTPAAAAAGAVQGSASAAAPGTPPLLQASRDPLPVWPGSSAGPQSKKEETGTYALSKHTTHTEAAAGRVKRISAAVVVNDREGTEGAGKLAHAVWKPRSAEEMRRLEGLAQAAVGFDGRRGDQVVIENVSFSSNAAEIQPTGLDRVSGQVKGLLATQPGLLRTGMVGIIGLLLVLVVLRPAVRVLVQPMTIDAAKVTSVTAVEPSALPSSVEPETIVEEAMKQVSPPAPLREEARRLRGHGVGVFDQVNEHIRRDPQQSTRLLEMWIGDDAEAQA